MTLSLTLTMEPPEPHAEPVYRPRLGRSVSIDQAATLLGVCRRTIYNRIRDGSLQTVRTLGGSQRVLVESLDEYRKAVWGNTPPEPPPPIERPKPRPPLQFVPRDLRAKYGSS
jgi:excisionase family DNA binding protein